MRDLNERELKAMGKTVELFNALVEMEQSEGAISHPDDMADLKFHVHAIQNIIAAKPFTESQLLKML